MGREGSLQQQRGRCRNPQAGGHDRATANRGHRFPAINGPIGGAQGRAIGPHECTGGVHPVPEAVHQLAGSGAINLWRRGHRTATAGEFHLGDGADRGAGEEGTASPQAQVGRGALTTEGRRLQQLTTGLVGLLARQMEQAGPRRQLQVAMGGLDEQRQGMAAAEPTGHQGRGTAQGDTALGSAEAQVGSGPHPEGAAGRGGEGGHLQHQLGRPGTHREIAGRLQHEGNGAAQDGDGRGIGAAGQAEASAGGAVAEACQLAGAPHVGKGRDHQIAAGFGAQGTGAAVEAELTVKALQRAGGTLAREINHRCVEGSVQLRFGPVGGGQGPAQGSLGIGRAHPQARGPVQAGVGGAGCAQVQAGGGGSRHQGGGHQRLPIQRAGPKAQLEEPHGLGPEHQSGAGVGRPGHRPEQDKAGVSASQLQLGSVGRVEPCRSGRCRQGVVHFCQKRRQTAASTGRELHIQHHGLGRRGAAAVHLQLEVQGVLQPTGQQGLGCLGVGFDRHQSVIGGEQQAGGPQAGLGRSEALLAQPQLGQGRETQLTVGTGHHHLQ